MIEDEEGEKSKGESGVNGNDVAPTVISPKKEKQRQRKVDPVVIKDYVAWKRWRDLYSQPVPGVF